MVYDSKAMAVLRALVTPETTQTEVARKIGVSRQTVWAWAQGHAQPNPEAMAKLETEFGIPRPAWGQAADEPDAA